jgi:glycosyltransferase involved in cell wall biosynthesis
MPFPSTDGGAQLMLFIAKGLLENNVEVKTLAINPTRNFIDLKTLPEHYVKSTRFEAVKVDTRIKPLKLLLNLFRKESYFIERFLSKRFEEKLELILRSEGFDIIQLEHLYLCKYIKTIRAFSNAKILLRPQNIEYVIWERYISSIKNPLKKKLLFIANSRLKKFEKSVNGQLDGILPLTKEDADIFASFSNKSPISIVPMGYDYEKLKNYDYKKQYIAPPVVYHLASMDWLPNVEAIKWFLENVLPYIQMQQLEVKFIVAGKKMPSWVYKYKSKNLEVVGEVVNPIQFQEDKPIMIVPLWSGSGIRAKIVEGLALGKTIIATTIGAQGIEYENGKNILIADTPSDFAKQIIRCVSSPGLCKEIGQSARELSFNCYHYKSTAKKWLEAVSN